MEKYRRYDIRVSRYENLLRIEVNDNYWDSHDYAFIRPDAKAFTGRSSQISTIDPRFTSYSDVAADHVAAAFRGLDIALLNLKPGKRYAIYTDGVWGKGPRQCREI